MPPNPANLPRRNFAELRQGLNYGEESGLISIFICDVALFVIFMAVFANCIYRGARCGIPILMWLLVHLSMLVANSLLKLLSVCFVRHRYAYRACYSILTSLSDNLAMICWLIYGNTLYFTDKNDCGLQEETRGLNTLMLFFFVMGFF